MKKPTADRILDLNQGAESKNLMETLAIDFDILLANTLSIHVEKPMSGGILQRMSQACNILLQRMAFNDIYELKDHTSDTIRGLVCYCIAAQPLSFSKKLDLILPLADDLNAGVREWAWLACRPFIINDIIEVLPLLQPLTHHQSERIRRFAVEITRPRGVWCASITSLRKQPQNALILLESLKNDPALYVQKSVGNWLNDAAKDHPELVMKLVQDWIQASPTKNTHFIAKRALRNLIKNKL
jgi:3-methyladenine DNA glycosylase AlkC